MISIELKEVGEWLHESEQYKSILQMHNDEPENEEYFKIINK